MSETVLIIGVSSFVGSHITKILIDNYNYNIIGTVMDDPTQLKYKWIKNLNKNHDKLTLIKGNIGDTLIWKKIIDYKINYIFYTYNIKNIETHKQGLLNIFNACLNKDNIKHIVITSSFDAIFNAKEKIYNESDWNQTTDINSNGYIQSKIEKVAYQFFETHKPKWILSSVNPGNVIGPELHDQEPLLSESNQLLLNIISGETAIKFPIEMVWVDVRDIALCYVLIIKHKSPNRHVIVNQSLSVHELTSIVNEKSHELKIVTVLPKYNCQYSFCLCCVFCLICCQPKSNKKYIATHAYKMIQFDVTKIKKLGIKFMPIQQTITDTMEFFRKKKHLKSMYDNLRVKTADNFF